LLRGDAIPLSNTIVPRVHPLPKLRQEKRQATSTSASRTPQPSTVGATVHLDALRGFAAFSVLLSHWRDALFVDYSQLGHGGPLMSAAYLFTGMGHQWVIVFFVMSGYFVGGSVLRSVERGSWSWRHYLLARLTRLYVVLLPALLFGGALDWMGMHLAGTELLYGGRAGLHELTVNVHDTLTPVTLLANGFFLQTIVLGSHQVATFGTNGPLWSLCNEFWYYLAFPALVLSLSKSQSLNVRVGCALALMILGWFTGWSIIILGVPWLMGVFIPYLPTFTVRSPGMRIGAIVAALALVTSGLVLTKLWLSLGATLLLGASVTLLIWVTLRCANGPLPTAYVWLARRAAHSSYTLYLVQMPMLIFLKASLHLPRATPGLLGLLVGIGVLVAILVYAQLVYELFEKKTQRVREWLKPYVIGSRTA